MTAPFFTITARDWRDSIQRARAQRNEIAEQIKLHMSTNNDGWILRSEREPADSDYPIWLHEPNAKDGFPTWIHGSKGIRPYRSGIYWKPAAADIPAPPREKTQADKDREAFKAYNCSGVGCGESAAWGRWSDALKQYWHAALAYERAEVGKMLPSSDPATYNAHYATDVIKAIRARCGGGK